MFLQAYLSHIRRNPVELFVGLCIMFTAIMGTSVNHVASISYSLLTLAGLTTLPRWKKYWRNLDRNEQWMLIGFSLYAVIGLLAYINVDDTEEYFRDLERYIRFIFIVPAYFYIKKNRLDVVPYLYAGAIISGPFLIAVAYHSYLNDPDMPARGEYHHIIFGSLAMLNVGVMLSLLLSTRLSMLMRLVVMVSIMCAIAAAIMSQSRGVWLVLPLYVAVTLYMSWRHSLKRFLIVLLLVALGAVVFSMTPAKKVIDQRVETAAYEFTAFFQEDKYATSIGQRLAMWEIAYRQWEQHPIIGIGPGDFDNVIMELQSQGHYVGMEVHASTHNIYMQALVNTGLLGLLITCFALFYQPAKVMLAERKSDPSKVFLGLNVLLLFAVVGLSESWILRLPTVSVYIIYIFAITSSFVHKQDEDIYI